MTTPATPNHAPLPTERRNLDRRAFLRQSATLVGSCTLGLRALAASDSPPPHAPIGTARGACPGRVVWAHDPEVMDWKGPGDGHWWAGERVKPDRVDALLARTLCELAGESRVDAAWSRLFRYSNRSRGRAELGYQPGQRVVIKPNWVGLIYREGHVDLDTYRFIRRHDYMNTAPPLLLGLLRQLTGVGVRPADITICDTLACVVNEFFELFQPAFPGVRFVDYGGKFGRFKAAPSRHPLFWSHRPPDKSPDYVPACFADADYVINVANLKAHTAGGVTLCAKNHYGSLVRWPVQQGYFDIHPGCFSTQTGVYRPLVDLMGHAHFGGKTVLHLIDGLFSGVHPRDPVPQRLRLAPFNGHWPCSLFASQDPVAIDSVGFDFLWSEFGDFPRKGGVEDYLHEAALASDPPSGTFYDPNHADSTQRLPSLGVHEHWNNPRDRKYSRNLGLADGIELVTATLGSRRAT